MQWPSLSVVLSGVFIAYILHSIYTIGSLYVPPKCTGKKNCAQSYLESNPKLQLVLFTTTEQYFSSKSQASLLDRFDVNPETEMTKQIDLELPLRTRRNGTLFLHAFLTRKSHGADFSAALNDPTTTYTSAQVTLYQVPPQHTFNLITDSQETITEARARNSDKDAGKVVTHLYSKFIVNILDHRDSLPKKDLPPDIAHVLTFSPDGKQYLPILHIDLLGSRLKDLVPVNTSISALSITLEYAPISFGKLRLWMQFTAALHTLRQMGFTEKDVDELKGLFADTNIVLLCLTFVVAALHMLFDFLAFKNDIYFWRNRENMIGVSSRTLLWRAFSQFVIFLYLMEENTSLLVVIPAGVGTLIELWKVTKAFRITVQWPDGGSPLPRLRFGPSQSKEEEQTEEYDSLSMKYLSYVLYPLCIAGAVYSLVYTSHRSWYSWLIQSVVNGVYAFGFLFMLPQLFVNYKLKSVAHLPWRAFMYKAFNTFIDDIFAFIITMPTAHRVACFRDDIVFVVYLYQRWLYPVDRTRANEFGTIASDETPKDGQGKDKKD